MAESRGVYLQQETLDATEDMVDRGRADNENEALNLFIAAGMREYGYKGGQNGDTTLKRLSAEFARAFTYIGIAWLAITMLFPVGFRLGAAFAFSAALACSGVYLLLERREPRVSNWLAAAFGGGGA